MAYSYFPPYAEMLAQSRVMQDHPHLVLAGVLTEEGYPRDPMVFFERFGVAYDTVKAQGYTPLLLAISSSNSGEEAESFGLFQKEGRKGPELFEVSGTECSVWDFNGQWDPDLTTPAALWHRLTKGRLGLHDDSNHDDFNTALKTLVLRMDPSLEFANGKNAVIHRSRPPKRRR